MAYTREQLAAGVGTNQQMGQDIYNALESSFNTYMPNQNWGMNVNNFQNTFDTFLKGGTVGGAFLPVFNSALSSLTGAGTIAPQAGQVDTSIPAQKGTDYQNQQAGLLGGTPQDFPAQSAQPTLVAQPVQAQATDIQPATLPPTQPQGLQMPTFYKPDPNSQTVFNAQGQPLTYDEYIAQGGTPNFTNVKPEPVPTNNAPTGQNSPSGLNFEQGAAANASNPPQYDQQGMLIPGTGGLKEQVNSQQQQQQNVLTQNGIDTNKLTTIAKSQSPLITFADTYKQMVTSMGLPDIKAQYDVVQKKYSDLQNELNDKIQDINDNPWLTEGVRQKQIQSLQNKYEGKLKILTDQIGQYDSLYKQGQQQAQFVAEQAVGMAHNQQVLDQQMQIAQMNLAEKQLEFGANLGKGTSDIQEYNYAVSQGYTGTLLDWQRENANLKAKAAGAGNLSGLTDYQATQAFIGLSNKYQADAIINQAINGQTAVQIADQVIKDPSKATSQLASLYLLVKNLDPTSAVREGELALANQTQSYLQQFSNTFARINEGRVIAPDAAKQLALATKELANAWNQTAARRQTQYQAQANTVGIGDKFNQYLGGYQSNFGNNTQTGNTVGGIDLSQLDFSF